MKLSEVVGVCSKPVEKTGQKTKHLHGKLQVMFSRVAFSQYKLYRACRTILHNLSIYIYQHKPRVFLCTH